MQSPSFSVAVSVGRVGCGCPDAATESWERCVGHFLGQLH